MNIFHRCAHPPTLVVQIGNISYYGAGRSEAMDFDGDFVINLSGVSNIMRTEGMKDLTDLIQYPFEEIMVPWPDFKLPKVEPEFWEAAHQFSKDKGWTDVCVHCMGGHGRTGTALASLIIVNAGKSALEAVDIVRQNYCDMAIETLEQCMYLQQLDNLFNNGSLKEKDCPEPSMMYGLKEDE